MVYGAGMPFQAARSRRVMPLSAAMRYRFCPRCTVVVTPYLGVDTETGALPVGARRTTWLLPQPASTRQASASPASAPAFIRTTSCVRMPDKVADGAEQQHRGDPAKRLDPAAQCRLGAGAAEADRAGDQIHALAAADEHAGHEREQGQEHGRAHG